jgi:hypothetical protein
VDVEEDGIKFSLLGSIPLPSSTIKISDIQDIRVASPIEQYKPRLLNGRVNKASRLWGGCVVITKKQGYFKTIVITPDDPAEFVKRVKQIQQEQPEALQLADVIQP